MPALRKTLVLLHLGFGFGCQASQSERSHAADANWVEATAPAASPEDAVVIQALSEARPVPGHEIAVKIRGLGEDVRQVTVSFQWGAGQQAHRQTIRAANVVDDVVRVKVPGDANGNGFIGVRTAAGEAVPVFVQYHDAGRPIITAVDISPKRTLIMYRPKGAAVRVLLDGRPLEGTALLGDGALVAPAMFALQGTHQLMLDADGSLGPAWNLRVLEPTRVLP